MEAAMIMAIYRKVSRNTGRSKIQLLPEIRAVESLFDLDPDDRSDHLPFHLRVPAGHGSAYAHPGGVGPEDLQHQRKPKNATQRLSDHMIVKHHCLAFRVEMKQKGTYYQIHQDGGKDLLTHADAQISPEGAQQPMAVEKLPNGTLPVTAAENILSKGIASLIWILMTVLTAPAGSLKLIFQQFP